MDKKSINSNKQFMVGNGILAFGVFFIVCLFLYLGFRNQRKTPQGELRFSEKYTFEFAGDFAGDSLSVYVNDSLLLSRRFDSSTLIIQTGRFAEENMLMVVDNRTESIYPFNLKPEGGKIGIAKQGGKVVFAEKE